MKSWEAIPTMKKVVPARFGPRIGRVGWSCACYRDKDTENCGPWLWDMICSFLPLLRMLGMGTERITKQSEPEVPREMLPSKVLIPSDDLAVQHIKSQAWLSVCCSPGIEARRAIMAVVNLSTYSSAVGPSFAKIILSDQTP